MTTGSERRLSTHVLDVSAGKPAAGMKIILSGPSEIPDVTPRTYITNEDGRTQAPLLQGDEVRVGSYRLTFFVADYYQKQGHPDAGRFLRVVPVDFVIESGEVNYHVPLLVSPWSYSTYRGS
jgi:5-hydroxyisourate hydrolase